MNAIDPNVAADASAFTDYLGRHEKKSLLRFLTGGSVDEVIDVINAQGGVVAGVGVLVNRSGGKAAFGDAAFTSPEIKSPAQIEKLSSRGKELALEYGYKPESAGLSVAPLSDPRPEAKPRTNANVFEGHSTTFEDAGF